MRYIVEVLIFLGLVAIGGWYTFRGIRRAYERTTARRQLRMLNEQQRRQAARDQAVRAQQARQQHLRLNQLYARMQTALLQLSQAPDFQRAAALAAHAHEVPAVHRQRQFQRYRATLVEHFAQRLTGGGDEDVLRTSLTALVQALGVAAFEAQYIEVEARQRISHAGRREPVSYDGRLQRLQADHEQRMATLRSLEGLDEELREQLVETEQNRHRDALLAAGNEQPQPLNNR